MYGICFPGIKDEKTIPADPTGKIMYEEECEKQGNVKNSHLVRRL